MSGKEQPPIMDQKLCVAGCGFFGSSQTSNMCSKCWASKSLLAADSQGKKEGNNVGSSSLPPLTLSKPSAAPAPTAMDECDDTAPPAPAPVAEAEAGGAPSSDAAAGATAAPLTPPAEAAPAVGTAAAAATAESPPVLPPQPPAPISAPAAAAAPAVAASPSPFSVAPAPSPLSFSVGGPAAAPAIGGGAEAEGAAGAAVATAAAMAAAAEAPARPEQKNRKRCFTCSKKVGYTGIACRCNYVFCSLHRYPEQHDCTFDFKTSDRNDLKRTVVGGGQFSKVDRL